MGAERATIAQWTACLEVRAGELVAVMGPSGSGQSSLLQLADGLDPPTTGEVRLAGRSIGGLSVKSPSWQIGFLTRCPAADSASDPPSDPVVRSGRSGRRRIP